jgi:ubiquinone biosynthesis protein UbiJ
MDDLTPALGKFLADIASKTTNQALYADPGLLARLGVLQGRCIEIQCTAPTTTWHLNIAERGIETVHGPAEAPAVIVRGAAIDLARWLAPGKANGHVTITGDDTLLLEVLEILRDFDPDLASPLSKLLGPELSDTLLGTAEMGLKGLQSLFAGVGQSVKDQAAGNFVQQTELNSLLTGIDKLRLRVDRLAAKVRRHEQSRRQASPGKSR